VSELESLNKRYGELQSRVSSSSSSQLLASRHALQHMESMRRMADKHTADMKLKDDQVDSSLHEINSLKLEIQKLKEQIMSQEHEIIGSDNNQILQQVQLRGAGIHQVQHHHHHRSHIIIHNTFNIFL